MLWTWKSNCLVTATVALAVLAAPVTAEVHLPLAAVSSDEEVAGALPANRAAKTYHPFPAPDSGYVTDIADLLSTDEEERLERWLWQTESRTGVEIAVVTIGSVRDYPGTPNRSIESFATALFNAYGIGNRPANNGILLLIAKDDRDLRIELGAGYPLSRNTDAKRIIDNVIVPRFRTGNYAEGVTEGIRALMLDFAGVRTGINWSLIILAVAALIGVLIAISLFRQGKRGWGWVTVGVIVVLLLAIWRLLATISRHMPIGSSSGWSPGGFGGGFGGGFSGGGGASGHW